MENKRGRNKINIIILIDEVNKIRKRITKLEKEVKKLKKPKENN